MTSESRPRASGHTAILRRDLPEREIEKRYSKVAPFYDLWGQLTESQAAEKAMELADIQNGERILEVAVGTAAFFREIVKRNAKGENCGVELSAGMLARAQKRLQQMKGANFHLLRASAYRLPFQAGSFDLVVSNYMMDMLPEADFVPVLSEFHRVLKPPGRMVISTMAFGSKWYNRFWYWLARELPSLLLACRPIKLDTYLAEAGFGNLHREAFSQMTFPSEVIRAEKTRLT